MTKLIIKEEDGVRLAWYFPGTSYPYYLEVNDRVKGWVPLMLYDSRDEALAGMEALIRSSRKEASDAVHA